MKYDQACLILANSKFNHSPFLMEQKLGHTSSQIHILYSTSRGEVSAP